MTETRAQYNGTNTWDDPNPGRRVRINVKTGAKGQKTWDCTVEMETGTIYDALAESDLLVAELEDRYPNEKL